MKLIAILLLALACNAQTLTITGPAVAKPGNTVTVSVPLAGTTEAAGLQWSMTAAPVTTMTATAGPAATAALKTLYTHATNALLVGINANKIAPGDVARYMFVMPPNSVTLTLTNPLAADLKGTAILLKPGAALTINPQPVEDINGDGRIDTIDVQISIDQIQGRTTCGSSDVTGDGKCDLYDALKIINAALEAGV